MASVGHYNNKGLYNKYNKSHKEREALDYYATSPAETTNILNVLNLDLRGMTILEPSAGGGHMVKGILDYINSKGYRDGEYKIIATDVQERPILDECRGMIAAGPEYDFLADDYPYSEADILIMNPPYTLTEPFVIRSLEIAKKGLLMLARLQFLETQNRYENILKDNPPTDVWVYVDRIKCYKNGDFSQTESSAQAYCWVYWCKEKMKGDYISQLHWIRRMDKLI